MTGKGVGRETLDRHAFRSPSTFTTITVRLLAKGTPPATYVPAGPRESLLGAAGRPCSGNGVGRCRRVLQRACCALPRLLRPDARSASSATCTSSASMTR
jgi:hypothetical protein